MEKHGRKTKFGFTLVELVIVLGIFGLLTLAGTEFLILVVRNGAKASIENEVRQTANFILQDMVNEVRNSKCVYYAFNAASRIVTVNVSDDLAASLCLGDPRNGISYTQSGTGVFTKTTYVNDAGTAAILTSRAVAVHNCGGTANSCGLAASCANGLRMYQADGTTALASGTTKTDGMGISIWVQQANLSANQVSGCAIIRLSDTAVPRRY